MDGRVRVREDTEMEWKMPLKIPENEWSDRYLLTRMSLITK